ncbi:hypothetical protein [Mesorhizobium sp. M0701]|uniref:hypothetical protein n=1 Tax=Mesorhizobium sp. M0701 TaxID=2956989 RepID=UPI003339ABD1
MAQIAVIKYEYAPPGREDGSKVTIMGLKEYSPGDHSGRVDEYLIEIPDGILSFTKWESDNWAGVLANLKHWFDGETDEGLKERVTLVWADPVQFPHLRSR